ncbi:hypothetical protein HAX54_048682 [Datura stramonium]|uniref:Uncharacterized protein n=1 Tax=Datura stramonium TaxID=4076 RepID=A0ABS8SUS2_DATST|nr:hypothetical protein [Datura stramonium]
MAATTQVYWHAAMQCQAWASELITSKSMASPITSEIATAALFTTAASSANAGVIDDYLEKSKANKELNDKKRPAKQKKVPFLSEDLALEEGKDKYKCGSNVFWKCEDFCIPKMYLL